MGTQSLEAMVSERLASAPIPSDEDPRSPRHWLAIGEILLDLLLETAPAGAASRVMHDFRARAAAGDESARDALRLVDHRAVAELTGDADLFADSVPEGAVVAYVAAVKDLVGGLAAAHDGSALAVITRSISTASAAGVKSAPDLGQLLRVAAQGRAHADVNTEALGAPSDPTTGGPPYPGVKTSASPRGGHDGGDAPEGRGRGATRLGRLLGIAGAAVVLVGGGVSAFALATVERTVVVDVPEREETFSEEAYETTDYEVVGSDSSVCTVGQDWYECLELGRAEYRDNCTRYEDVLTPESGFLCGFYQRMIADMENQNAEIGSTVASVPRAFMRDLTAQRAMAMRQVPNGDYEPAVTHIATCYLGFLGECP
jgi:hypothetical protein